MRRAAWRWCLTIAARWWGSGSTTRALSDPRVKMLCRGGVPIDAAFFASRVEAAAALRAALPAARTNGYRLLYGESDGLPGLVVDRYDDVGDQALQRHLVVPPGAGAAGSDAVARRSPRRAAVEPGA